jgi:hypothetical protein
MQQQLLLLAAGVAAVTVAATSAIVPRRRRPRVSLQHGGGWGQCVDWVQLRYALWPAARVV